MTKVEKVAKKPTVNHAVADYLARPYARLVIRDDDGMFRAEIVEFPGCLATGETAAKALESLEDVAASWLEAAIVKGLRVPEPIENGGAFSGKLMLRLPKTLHKKAAHAAERDGVSLNQFIVASIAEQVGRVTASVTSSPRIGLYINNAKLTNCIAGKQTYLGIVETTFIAASPSSALCGGGSGSVVATLPEYVDARS
jgi:antitoxin HicB